MKQKKFKQDRKWWYRALLNVSKLIWKKPKFIYLGEKPLQGAIILSNHVASFGPLTIENYVDFPVRIWGTHEMNESFASLYKYQTNVYYHQKKGWNLALARLACLIISPITYFFYKGLRLISTYPDTRFRKTLNYSLQLLQEGKTNIVIFPEDSSRGYFDEITKFFAGFVLLAEKCLKNGINVPIYVSYLKKKPREYIFDAPIKYSELKAMFGDRKTIAEQLRIRCNELSKLNFN